MVSKRVLRAQIDAMRRSSPSQPSEDPEIKDMLADGYEVAIGLLKDTERELENVYEELNNTEKDVRELKKENNKLKKKVKKMEDSK